MSPEDKELIDEDTVKLFNAYTRGLSADGSVDAKEVGIIAALLVVADRLSEIRAEIPYIV